MLNKEAQEIPQEAAQQQTAQSMPTPSMNEGQIEVVAKKKKLRKLTYKQREFVARYFKNKGNGTKTALEVYDTTDYNTAHAISSENLQKPAIISELERHYIAQGFTKEEFTNTVVKEIRSSVISPKDKAKYLQIYIDTTPGVKAPTRQERIIDNTYTLNLNAVKTISLEARKAIQNALQDTNYIKPTTDMLKT